MSLVKWTPQPGFVGSLANWLDEFFDEGPLPASPEGGGVYARLFPLPAVKGVTIPAVNITETPEAFNLEVAAPGFKKDDLKLEIENNRMTISAEVKEEKVEENKDEKYSRREFRYNSFRRTFTLPENANPEKIVANYNDGILRVNVPKRQPDLKPMKTIEIK